MRFTYNINLNKHKEMLSSILHTTPPQPYLFFFHLLQRLPVIEVSSILQTEDRGRLLRTHKLIIESSLEGAFTVNSIRKKEKEIINYLGQFVRLISHNLVDYILQQVDYMQILRKSQRNLLIDCPLLQEYFETNQSLLNRQAIPQILKMLNAQRNVKMFLQYILNYAPHLIVHQLIFIAIHEIYLFRNFHSHVTSLHEIIMITGSNSWPEVVCRRPQLIWLNCHALTKRPLDEMQVWKLRFLNFYLLTVLLVSQYYFRGARRPQ